VCKDTYYYGCSISPDVDHIILLAETNLQDELVVYIGILKLSLLHKTAQRRLVALWGSCDDYSEFKSLWM